MKFETLKFYWQCFLRTFRELFASYGLATQVQKANTLLTIAPFVTLATVKIANNGLRLFIADLTSNSLDVLFSFVWFVVVLLTNIVRSPYLLKKDSDLRATDFENRLKEITEQLQSRLSIEFQDSSPWVQSNGETNLLRVRVTNLSPIEPLRNVKVQLAKIEPVNLPALPMTLHQMHDNPLPASLNLQTFDLAPSGFHFIDVLNIVKSGQEVLYYIEHAVRNIPKNPLSNVSSVTISAYSDNCPPQTETFDITKIHSRPVFLQR